MRRFFAAFGLLTLLAVVSYAATGGDKPAAASDWHMNATIIEACSCPMFCQCYFNTKPASHGGHEGHGGGGHFCKFNNAYRINSGHYGALKLDGVKYWIGGDLGGDFSKGEMDWAVLTFEPGTSPEVREAVKAISMKVFGVKWASFTVGEDRPIAWTASKDRAEAKLDGGKAAEVVLTRFPGMSSEPVVIKNLKYWGAPRNEGFVLMPNEVEAWRQGDKRFEFKGTNGFMITFDIASKDVS